MPRGQALDSYIEWEDFEHNWKINTLEAALSKTISEEMARQFSRTTGTTSAGLRISNIMVAPDDYERFLTFQDDLRLRKWNLWGYVDARDVAQACRLALEERYECWKFL